MNSDVLLIPVTAVQPDLVTQTDVVVYVPLASKDAHGIVKIGDGLDITQGGLLSLGATVTQNIATSLNAAIEAKSLAEATKERVDILELNTPTKLSQLTDDVGFAKVNALNDFKQEQYFTKGFTVRSDTSNRMPVFKTDHMYGDDGVDYPMLLYSVLDSGPKTYGLRFPKGGGVIAVKEDLVNYYKKTETYSKEEVDLKISEIPKFDIKVVTQLPTVDISSTTIYLVKSDEASPNLYDEYIFVNGQWEFLGSQTVNLSDYVTKTTLNDELSNYATISLLETTIGGVSDLLGETEDLEA